MIVKICGITNIEDAKMVASLGATAIGLNFYPKSPRFVDLKTAKEIALAVATRVTRVGVFVNESPKAIIQYANAVGLDEIQLSGDEDENIVKECRSFGLIVIKAIRAESLEKTLKACKIFSPLANTLLFDAPASGLYGGTGKEISSEIISNPQVQSYLKSAYLSGGLKPENIESKLKIIRPLGVDVASGVESMPGKKSEEKVKNFIEKASAFKQ